MGRLLLLGLAMFSLAACAKPAPPTQHPLSPNPCTGGFIALYFEEDSAALSASMNGRLDWPLRAKAQCNTLRLKVFGLPDPSNESLQGRRAASVKNLLEAFGLPTPLFELGDDESQAEPALGIEARPNL